MRIFTLCFLTFFSPLTMADDIFIHSNHSGSKRFAILEDDGKIAYLYLTRSGTQQPEKDAIAYSRLPPVAKIDWKTVKEAGGAPPLSHEVASPQAVIQHPKEREFSFKWSSDGHAVALIRNGEPIAFISMSEKFGYSKAVSKPSPLANVWNQHLYETIFRTTP